MMQKSNIITRILRYIQKNIFQGQIQIDSSLGTVLRQLASLPECKIYVEIGTWNGRGSTRCIVDELRKRKDASCLWSLESNRHFYQKACRYWFFKRCIDTCKGIPKLRLLLGRIIEKEELPSAEQIIASPLFAREHFDKWYTSDIANYQHTSNVIHQFPLKIDVLLLDGGEYSTEAEFRKLVQRTDIIVLDDTLVFKSHAVREILQHDEEWETLLNREDDRNGFFVACRKNISYKNHLHKALKIELGNSSI